MLRSIRRYLRAFVLALRYTVQREKPPLLKLRDEQPDLAAWWQKTVALVEGVEQAAAVNGIDPAGVKLRIDRRDISMKTILATVRFHAEQDYPYLVAHYDAHDQLALQSINLNDRYLITQLGNVVDARLKASIEMLGEHLAIPPAFSADVTGKTET